MRFGCRSGGVDARSVVSVHGPEVEPVTYQVDFGRGDAALSREGAQDLDADAAKRCDPDRHGRGVLHLPDEGRAEDRRREGLRQRTTYFEFDHPEGLQIVRHKFTIKTHEVRWDIDPAKVTQVKEWPASFAPFLRREAGGRRQRRHRCRSPDRPGLERGRQGSAVGLRMGRGFAEVRSRQGVPGRQFRERDRESRGALQRLSRPLLRDGPGPRLSYADDLRHEPVPEELAVALQDGGVSASLRLGAVRRRRDAGPRQDAIKKNPELDAATKENLVRGPGSALQGLPRQHLVPPDAAASAIWNRRPPGRPPSSAIYAEADGVAAFPEPDPANKDNRTFAWMTVHSFRPDRVVTYPFRDLKSLMQP